MSRTVCIIFCLMLLALAGCNRPKQETTGQPPAAQPASPPPQQAAQPPTQPASPTPSNEVSSPVEAPAPAQQKSEPKTAVPITRQVKTPAAKPPATKAPTIAQPSQAAAQPAAVAPIEPPAAPKAVEPVYATIPSGAAIKIRLLDPLDSSVNKAGETFRAILDKELSLDGKTVAPRGSNVEGLLLKVERSGHVKGRAAMSFELTKLIVGDQSYALQTDALSFEAESTQKKDATKVGVGAGLGAIIGAIAGGGKGAAIGAAVGAGAGGATVVATRGKELQFDREYKFNFKLRQDVQIKVP